MTFLVFFVIGGWIVIVGAICGFVWWQQRKHLKVSDHWLDAHLYKRSGDLPPGTSRQEEGR